MNLLTLREVASFIRVSESTVRRLVRAGDLVAYKIGSRGQLRFQMADVEQFIARQRVSAAADLPSGGETNPKEETE